MKLEYILQIVAPMIFSLVCYLIKKGNDERKETNAKLTSLIEKFDDLVKKTDCNEDMKTHCKRLERLEQNLSALEKTVISIHGQDANKSKLRY